MFIVVVGTDWEGPVVEAGIDDEIVLGTDPYELETGEVVPLGTVKVVTIVVGTF